MIDLLALVQAIVLLLCVVPTYLFFLGIVSILLKLREKVWLNPKLDLEVPVAILLPLYMENENSVLITINSILSQDYNVSLMRVLLLVEEGDNVTKKAIQGACKLLNERNINFEVIEVPGPRSTKAKALNYALNYVKEPVVVIYDADDEVNDKLQIAKGTSLIANHGYKAVGVKVIRYGENTPGLFSFVETNLWINIGLPGIAYVLKYPILSGEGLFVSTEAIKSIGGFSETLTEDAMLTVEFAKRGFKMGLLNSVVYEKGPKSVKSLTKQRLRWYRGMFQCFIRVAKAKGLPLKLKIGLGLYYLSPTSYVVYLFSLLYVVALMTSGGACLAETPILTLASLYILVSITIAPLFLLISNVKITRGRTLIIPAMFWALMGVISLFSLIHPKVAWYKTERSES